MKTSIPARIALLSLVLAASVFSAPAARADTACNRDLGAILTAHAEKQQEKVNQLNKLLTRYASDKNARTFSVTDPAPVHRVTPKTHPELTNPTLSAPIAKLGRLDFTVTSKMAFLGEHLALRKKGFWILFNPSGPDDRIKSGHFTILVGETLFNRLGDGLGQMSLTSVPLEQVALAAATGKMDHPYYVAQFFELSEASTAALEKYFHDRVWYYHLQEANPVRSPYNPLPFTEAEKVPNGENCLSFVFSFLDQRYTELFPQLAEVRREFGNFSAVQIPIRQIQYNTRSSAYRGTWVLGDDPVALRERLLSGAFNEDGSGSQLLLEGGATPLVNP